MLRRIPSYFIENDLHNGVFLNAWFYMQTIIERLSSRRSCPKCGTIYNLVTNPPKQEGKCDCDLTDLIQREDDKPTAVKKRLIVYKKQTEPLIEYYTKKGIIVNIDSNPTIKEISHKVEKSIK